MFIVNGLLDDITRSHYIVVLQPGCTRIVYVPAAFIYANSEPQPNAERILSRCVCPGCITVKREAELVFPAGVRFI